MKHSLINKIIISCFFVLSPVLSWAACPGTPADCYTGTATAGVDTLTTVDCSYDAVSTTVGVATAGDTVIVPACAETTWATQLSITKGITLQGNGIGNTNIKSGLGSSTYLVKYAPASPSSNETFRLTGFTFDGNETSTCVQVKNTSEAYLISNIRIDHNRFYHCNTGVVFGEYYSGGMLGRISGVVDNNTFDDCNTFTRAYGSYETSWDNDPLDLGGPTGMYIEDNVMSMSSAWCSAHPAALHHASSGWGGRYAYRFNTINYDNGGWQDGFDVHGKQSCDDSHSGSVSTEIYGNKITYDTNSRFLFDRGGTGIIFNNLLTNASTLQITCENYSRPDLSPGPEFCCTEWPCPQMVSSYIWNNLNNGSNIGSVTFAYADAPSDDDILDENRDYWLYDATFDGTTGVGCGTLAARPATCTTGVSYWATNQSCSDLTGLVGDSTQRTSGVNTYLQGTLYKCTDTNTWTAYYTPYTYPHPLRGSDTVAPTATGYAINEAGSSFTVTFDERVTHGAGGRTGWVLTSDGGAVTATYSSGEGSTALVYQLSRTVYSTETVTGTYTQPTAGIVDTSANEFATVTDVSITNNSTATAGAPTYPKMTLSTGSNVTLSASGTGSFTLAP